MDRIQRLKNEPDCDGEYFELILTRTDDHEFVGVARTCTSHGVATKVESGERLADVWRLLTEENPPKKETMI